MPPKSYRHNAVPNRFSSHFSVFRTNGPRSLSRVKVGTLGFANRIVHSGSHAETGGFPSVTAARLCAASEIATERTTGEIGCTPMACVRFLRRRGPLGCAVLIVSQFTLYISAYRLCATLYLSVGYWRGSHDNRKATLYQKQQGVSLSMVMWCPL